MVFPESLRPAGSPAGTSQRYPLLLGGLGRGWGDSAVLRPPVARFRRLVLG